MTLRRHWSCARIPLPEKKCVVPKPTSILPAGITSKRQSTSTLVFCFLITRYYADTQLSLEEIALQFMEVHERGALRQYLLRKMADLPLKKRAQRTLLGTWLTEIYLDEINGMRVSRVKNDE